MRKLFSYILSVVLVFNSIGVGINWDVAKAATPSYTEYCNTYKDAEGFNYDRTKVPNPSISSYLEGLGVTEANFTLQLYKLDQKCMQIADIERLLGRATDNVKRKLLQAELEKLIEEENKIKNELRVLQEMQERIEKLLEMLRALAKAGKHQVSKTLVDLRAETLRDFDMTWYENNNEMDDNFESILKQVKEVMEQYIASTDAGKQAIIAQLESSVKAKYFPLKEELGSAKKGLVNQVTFQLESELDREESKFENAVRDEIQDDEELSKTVEAYHTLSEERKGHYMELTEKIVDASTVQADKISDIIEGVVGSTHASKSFLVAFLGEAADLVRTSESRVLPAVQEEVDSYEAIKPVMIELNVLMHSAEFRLLQILKSPIKTKRVIHALETDDHSGLADFVLGMTYEQLGQIKQEYMDMMQETELIQEILGYMDEEEENVIEEAKEMCKQYPQLTDVDCMKIASIAAIYGGYVDYIFSRVLGLTNPDLVALKEKAEAAHDLLIDAFSKYPSLTNKEKQLFRFKLLSSLFGGTKLVETSGITSGFVREISKRNGIVAVFLELLQAALNKDVEGGVCDTLLADALRDIFGRKSDMTCPGGVATEGLFVTRINAFRSSFGQSALDMAGEGEAIAFKYNDPVNKDGFRHHYNTSGHFMIRENGQVRDTSIVYFDEDKKPSIQIDPFFATFYKYDAKGRLITKKKMDVDRAVWNKNTERFTEPGEMGVSNTRVEWTYVSASKDQIRSRLEYVGGGSQPSKIITYRYLMDDVRNPGVFLEDKKKFLEGVQEQRNAFGPEFLDPLLSGLVSSMLISGRNGITMQNDFFYDELFILDFIKEYKPGRDDDRYIFLSHVEENSVEEKYSNVKKSATLDISSYNGNGAFTQINPILFIDANGGVIDDAKTIAGLKHTNVLSISGGIPLAGPFSSNDRDLIKENCQSSASIYLSICHYSFDEDEAETIPLPDFDNGEPLEKNIGSLLSRMYDLTGESLAGFTRGASEQLVLYGIMGVTFVGAGALVKIIAKKAGIKGLAKLGGKFIPYLGWGIAAYGVYEVVNYYPDRIEFCTEGDFEECGRLTVDLVANLVGLKLTLKSINVKKLTTAGKESLERVMGIFRTKGFGNKEKILNNVLSKGSKSADEVLTALNQYDDNYIDDLLADENKLQKFVDDLDNLPAQRALAGKSYLADMHLKTNDLRPRQPTENFDAIIALAEKNESGFNKKLDILSDLTHGRAETIFLKTDTPEGVERALQKIKYNKSYAGGLKDILRGSLVYEKRSDLYRAALDIQKEFVVVTVKNNIDVPLRSGLRNVNIVVKNKDGSLAEIQLLLNEMFTAKKSEEKIYNIIRELESDSVSTSGIKDAINKLKGDQYLYKGSIKSKVDDLILQAEANNIVNPEQHVTSLRYESRRIYDEAWLISNKN